MKHLYILIMVLCSAVTLQHASAQIPDDTDGRLYRLCKTWGYFKYFNQHKCELKWDTLLNTTVSEVLNANTNAEFNTALMNMFSKVGTNTLNPDPGSEPDTNLNYDNSWIDDPVFSQQVRNYLDTFTVYICPDTSACLVKYNDYLTSGYISYIDFRDDPLSMPFDFTNEANRLTVMFYYWNVINYFSPYRHLMDNPWDSTLYEFIPLFRQDSTSLQFQVTFLQLVTRINDTHGFTSSNTLQNQFWGGIYLPKICFTRIDSLCVVTKVQGIPGVTPGDILIKLKGIPMQEIEDSLAAFIPASTPASLYRDMYQLMMEGGYGAGVEMTLLDSNNSEYTVTPHRYTDVSAWYSWKLNNGSGSPYYLTTCDYGYVNMGLLQPSQVPAMYEALGEAPALIFDLRDYPNGTLWDIGPLLFPGPITSALYYTPALYDPSGYFYLPGWYYEGNDYYNLGWWNNPDAYPGKVYILVNEETQSQAEYTCQYFSYHPNSKVIGTQTAGADGNVSYLNLPGGIITYFTSLGWYYADGYQQQRNGVKIDSIVTPTRAGLRHGQDEILLAALDCLTGIPVKPGPVAGLSLYPNPVTGQILYLSFCLEHSGEVTVSLYNLTGKLLVQKVLHGKAGTNLADLRIPEVAPGLYLLKADYGGEVKTEKIVVR